MRRFANSAMAKTIGPAKNPLSSNQQASHSNPDSAPVDTPRPNNTPDENRQNLASELLNLPEVFRSTSLPGSAESNLLHQEHEESICTVHLTPELEILAMSRASEELFGIQESQLIGKPLSTLLPENFPGEHRSQLFTESFVEGADRASFLRGMNFQHKRALELEIIVQAMQVNGLPTYRLLIRDLTELRQLQSTLEEQTSRLQALMRIAPIGIMEVNQDWEAVSVNAQWLQICDRQEEELQGMHWIPILFGENCADILRELHQKLESSEAFLHPCELIDSTGAPRWAELNIQPLLHRDALGLGFVATLTDQTHWRQSEARLRQVAEQDALTGLANRRLMTQRLEYALKRVKRHGPLALLALDLDGFKNINDSLGHDAGDELLIEVAARLRKCVRDEDTVARVGGDEFLILLQDLEDSSRVAEIAEAVLGTLQQPVNLRWQEVFISTSIGIAFATKREDINAQALLKNADIALYRAKNKGRNNYQFYSTQLGTRTQERLDLGNSLHNALNRNEFEIYYQLQGNVKTGEITGLEALLRWNHPRRGLLKPELFIPILEETNIIVAVTRWVMRQSFRDMQIMRGSRLVNSTCSMSINLSPRLLRDAYLLDKLKSSLKTAGLNGALVNVEITESTLLEDSKAIQATLRGIKELGVKIILDDFGTGASSLTYLKRFPIDEIKIDKSFVQDLLRDADDRAITRAVLALGQSLNMKTTAEGVENDKTLELLAQWGCDYFQGYLLNEPLPLKELCQLLAHRKIIEHRS